MTMGAQFALSSTPGRGGRVLFAAQTKLLGTCWIAFHYARERLAPRLACLLAVQGRAHAAE